MNEVSGENEVAATTIPSGLREEVGERDEGKLTRGCIICFDTSPPPVQSGCACRGDAGLAHVSCRVRMAESQASLSENSVWWQCRTCMQHFTGEMRVGLAEAWLLLLRDHVTPRSLGFLNRMAAMANLSKALSARGDHGKAERLQQELLRVQQRLLGADHSLTMQTRYSLAELFRCQGKCAEAEAMQRELLVKHVKAGTDIRHAFVLGNDLGATLLQQGKFSEAEEMYRNVYDGAQLMGEEDPFTLNVATNFASSLSGQGKFTEAEQMYRQLLDAKQRVLGSEHPDTLWATGGLADTLRRQGRHGEAEQMYRELLDAKRRVLGAQHHGTLETLEGLAALLKDQDRQAETEQMQHELLDLRRWVAERAAEELDTELYRLPIVLPDPVPPNRSWMVILPAVAACCLWEYRATGSPSIEQAGYLVLLGVIVGLLCGGSVLSGFAEGLRLGPWW